MIPDEIRQQAIESLEEAMHLCDPDKGQSVCQRCLDRAATGLDAVLPIIAGWYEREMDRERSRDGRMRREPRNHRPECQQHVEWLFKGGKGPCSCDVIADQQERWKQKAEAERDALKDEREDSLSRWHQIAESEAEVKRLTEERDAALERERSLIAHAEKDGDDIEALEAERDELLAAAAVFKAQRDALIPLVRWLKEELEQAAIRAHPRLIYADRYALEDLPDNLRAVLDAALTETPNE